MLEVRKRGRKAGHYSGICTKKTTPHVTQSGRFPPPSANFTRMMAVFSPTLPPNQEAAETRRGVERAVSSGTVLSQLEETTKSGVARSHAPDIKSTHGFPATVPDSGMTRAPCSVWKEKPKSKLAESAPVVRKSRDDRTAQNTLIGSP